MADSEPAPQPLPEARNEDPTERSFLGGMRLKARSGVFLLVGALIIGGAGALLYYTDKLATDALAKVTAAQQIRELVTRIESGSLEIHGDGRNFLLEKDIRYAQNYDQRTKPVLANLDSLFKHPNAQDVNRHVSTVNDGIAQLAGQFTKIVGIQQIVGLSEAEGLGKLVKASAGALEQRLTATGNSPLIRELARLREVESQLIGGTSQVSGESISNRVAALGRSIGSSSLGDGAKSQLRGLLDAYAKDLGQLASSNETLGKEIARLGEINAYMAPSLDALITFSLDNLGAALKSQSEARQMIRQFIAGGVGGALLLTIIVGLLMIGSVTQPTSRLAAAASRLAHGDRSVSIPVLGNYDETGEIANALTYFRENIAQTDRLRKELEERLAETTATIADQIEEETDDEFEAPPPATPPAESVSPIAQISQMVTQTSQNASLAAHEAERTEVMVSGLQAAGERVTEIDRIISEIRDLTGLLAVQASMEDNADGSDENLIVLPSKSRDGDRETAAMSIEERVLDIQGRSKRAMELVREVGETINQVNNVAVDLAAETSTQALDAATELLRQSEDLRGILDNLLVKIRPDGTLETRTRLPGGEHD